MPKSPTGKEPEQKAKDLERRIEKYAQMEKDLAESEEYFRTTLDSIGDAVIAADTRGRITFMNRVAEALTGWNETEAHGAPVERVFRIVNEQTRLPVKSPIAEVLEKGLIVGLANHTLLVSRDGKEIPIADSGAPVKNEAGKTTGVVLVFRDETEELAYLGRIRASEENLRSLFNAIDESVFLFHRDGTLLAANDTFAQRVGQQAADCIGKSVYELIPADVAEGRKVVLQDVLRTGRPVVFEDRRGDRWLHHSICPIFDDEGKVDRLAVFAVDITARRQAEAALRLTQFSVDRASDAILWIGPDARFIYVNDAACLHFGYVRDDLIGMTVHDIDPDFPPEVWPAHWQEIEQKRHMVIESRHRRKDGTVIPVEVSLNYIEFDGQAYNFAFIRDLSARRQAESELQQLRLAVDQAAEIIVITDPEGGIRYVNPAFEQTTGYTREETIGRNPRILKSGRQNETFYRDLWDTITQGKTWQGRMVNRKKDGTLYTEDATISPVFDSGGKIVNFVALKRDMTEEIRLEERLKQAQKMEAIGTLAGGIAHDFNNILFPIVGFAEMIKEDLPADSPLQGYTDEILRAAFRSRDLVKQILAFSRKSEQDVKPVRLGPILEETVRLLRASIPKTIEIREQIDAGCGPVMADATQLHQIVMNLGTNAYHAMQDRGGVLGVSLRKVRVDSKHSELPPGEYARLCVSDSGVGMDKTVLARVFDPYFTTKPSGKGTGLGLAVVHGIVNSLGGDIRIFSEPGKGTECQVYLPLITPPAETKEPEEPAPPILGGTQSILLVDDEEAIARMEKQMLDRLGYRVTLRTSSVEALEAFRAHPLRFDLVVTDMTMPNMTGVQLAREVKKLRPDIPVIVCTGFSEQINEENFTALGIDGYVMKPVVRGEIAGAIRRVLDRGSNPVQGQRMIHGE